MMMNDQSTKDFVGKLHEAFIANGFIAEMKLRKGALVLTWKIANMEKELIAVKKLIAELAYEYGFVVRYANPGPEALNESSGKYEKEFIVRRIAE